VPTYYVWLLIVAFGLIPFYPVLQDFFWIRLGYHLLMLQDFFPSNFVAAFWSLGVEEQFYLLAPLVVLRLRRTRSLAIHLSVLGGLLLLPLLFRTLVFFAADQSMDYDQFFFRVRSPFQASADVLLFGMLAAFIAHFHREKPFFAHPMTARALCLGGFLLCASLLLVHPLLAEVSLFDASLLGTLSGLGFGAILLGLVLGRVPGTGWLQSGWLFFFAKISYSLYLVHMVFVPALYEWAVGTAGLALGPQLALFFPAYAVASIATALLLHYSVEKPSLMLKERLA